MGNYMLMNKLEKRASVSNASKHSNHGIDLSSLDGIELPAENPESDDSLSKIDSQVEGNEEFDERS